LLTVDDYDFVANDEIEVSAPLRVNFDQSRGHCNDAHASWHDGANANSEIHIVDPRDVVACQHRCTDAGALFGRQVDRTIRLTRLLLGRLLSRPGGLLALLLRRLLSGLRALLALLLVRAVAIALTWLRPSLGAVSLSWFLGLPALVSLRRRALLLLSLSLFSLFLPLLCLAFRRFFSLTLTGGLVT